MVDFLQNFYFHFHFLVLIKEPCFLDAFHGIPNASLLKVKERNKKLVNNSRLGFQGDTKID